MKKEVKISIDGLRIGMYVSRLDRPWIQTSFALEGLVISSKQDIDRLRNYSSYVFVDMDQGPTPDPQYWVLRELNKVQRSVQTVVEEQPIAADKDQAGSSAYFGPT